MINKVTYKEMAIARPLVVNPGWPGVIEVNAVNAFMGEWVVFNLPLSFGANAQIRMPVEEALEQGLITAASAFDYEDGEVEHGDRD